MQELKANMTGNVWKVIVNQGDKVEEGQEVVILESMKMEIPIEAEASGNIKELKVGEGDFVNDGDVIAIIE
ncbi:acetyl-CoA carboxylase biotin carboxyl carrier protein subunit [Oceanobacillus rekensis]|uniref:acetyl-CoA carboxylase biotin carboxyl carrier protein subunit n=1 Tax=Oceanobacillus rekensis TaxID=937927 RepID=UPI000B43839E|nr:acetyl-CoA carboxylase biotin carboxyl carrier protein subunit [Oceanobacillus rekensis]